MPYLLTITNNRTGEGIRINAECYTEGYNKLTRYAKRCKYPVTSIHGENLITAGTLHTEYFIHMQMTTHDLDT